MRLQSSASRSVATCILLLLTRIDAQFVVESLSFGQSGSFSTDAQSLPGWSLSGNEGHIPQLLSDRIVLTPPAPGNKRGALWSDHPLTYSEWNMDVEFRASGPERGSGNMQVWLTKEKLATAASVYTVDRFDGLVVELDQYAGSAGAVRGFLNDGTISFKNHHHVDGLSFGHCDYAYRNLGRMSKLKVKQAQDGFEISVDDRICFKTDQVQIPRGYYIGLSAASAETPDSYELSKFLVSTTTSVTRDEPFAAPPPPSADQPPPPPQQQEDPNAQSPPPDQFAPPDAQTFGTTTPNPDSPNQASRKFIPGRTGSNAPDGQFYQLLQRMELATNNINNVYRELKAVDERLQQRHAELLGSVGNAAPAPVPPPVAAAPVQVKSQTDLLQSMSRRIERIEQAVLKMQRESEGRDKDYSEHLTGLAGAIKETRESLMGTLPGIVTSSAPRVGFLVFVMVAVQLGLAGAYVVYKRRRANSPKKLL